MSAEYDSQEETESEEGGISLVKEGSDEMDIDNGSDTTPTSQNSGDSSSSSADAWGEMLPSSLDEFTEHGDLNAENQHTSASFNGTFHDQTTLAFSVSQAALSTASTPISEAPHNPQTTFAFADPDFGAELPHFHSNIENPHGEWADQQNGLPNSVLLFNGIQPPEFSSHFWSASSEVSPASTELLPMATENGIPTEQSGPPADVSEEETAQDANQNLPEGHQVLTGLDHTDGSDEDWLGLSEDSYNIFSSNIGHVNGTLPPLSIMESNPFFYYDDDEWEEEENFFSVSFFLYHWKQMYTSRKPDYPGISQLANDRAKVRRPDKITIGDREYCDYQGIHWDRFQTTKQEAREVRRMTYRNLTNCSPLGQNFGTKAFKATFPGAVLPNQDCYFTFKEMDMNRRPTYCHFQLRHNLSATSKNAIFYSYRPPRHESVSVGDFNKLQHKTIVCFNPETGTETCAMDFNKRNAKVELRIKKIHTLTAGNGVLVAGSFEGVYAMKSLSADFGSQPFIGTIAVGSDVSTNHIHTHLDRQSGLPRAVFDSNDRTVRILDCATSNWVACHKYPYQVNCSATNPDGRLRLLNGDNCEPIVANAETGETLAKLPGHNDFGFACDWAPDGITMATGHQDGLVKVWDARKLNQSIQTIAMEQAGCRSLQFSPLGSGKRVLVLAEPADFVHIIDAQAFESRQTIDFFGEISGISMPPDGSKLYIANADAKYGGLLEFERSRDSSKYNRRPYRVPDLEDDHEEMIDLIVDGVQPAQRFPTRIGDKLEQHVEPFMHGQGLPFVALSVIADKNIDCQRLFLECLSKGGGQGVTASEEWSTIAETFGIPREQAVSCAQQLCEYWQDNLAPYEDTLPYAQRLLRWELACGLPVSRKVPGHGNPKPGSSLHLGENHQYRRDHNDPRRKGFKIGRKSESLDWLSESDMEDDPRVNGAKGQRGRQWTSRPEIDDDLMI